MFFVVSRITICCYMIRHFSRKHVSEKVVLDKWFSLNHEGSRSGCAWVTTSPAAATEPRADRFQTGSGQTGSSQKCRDSRFPLMGKCEQNVSKRSNILQNVATSCKMWKISQNVATCAHIKQNLTKWDLWPFCENLVCPDPSRSRWSGGRAWQRDWADGELCWYRC